MSEALGEPYTEAELEAFRNAWQAHGEDWQAVRPARRCRRGGLRAVAAGALLLAGAALLPDAAAAGRPVSYSSDAQRARIKDSDSSALAPSPDAGGMPLKEWVAVTFKSVAPAPAPAPLPVPVKAPLSPSRWAPRPSPPRSPPKSPSPSRFSLAREPKTPSPAAEAASNAVRVPERPRCAARAPPARR